VFERLGIERPELNRFASPGIRIEDEQAGVDFSRGAAGVIGGKGLDAFGDGRKGELWPALSWTGSRMLPEVS